jgi:Carboxypeptidase regulatory-like domain
MFAVLFAGLASGQVASSSLLGVVTDPSSAPVPDVKITVRHEATGFSRTVMSGSSGQYRIDDLTPGSYSVAAEKEGFKSVVTGSVVLEVNQRGRIDLQLQLGASHDTVTVKAAASPVASDDASLGEILNSPTVLSLPLQTRDVASLVTLSASAVPRQLGGFTNDIASDYQGARGLVEQNAPVNGARSTMNLYLLDGAANTDRLVFAMALEPPLESVQEFRILTSQASAAFSQAGGGVVDVVTKSGGKAFHGSVFEYFRNEAADARNFFDDPNLPRPILRQNQFGASLGGPLPFRNTFFFATYEGKRGKDAHASVSLVPEAAVRAGNFSGRSAIFDPRNLSGTNTRAPFSNNAIPKDLLDPIAVKYLQQYEPLPNRSDPINNYLDSTPNSSRHDHASMRIDHQFRDLSQLFVRYTINDQSDRVNSSFPLRPTAEDTRAQQAAVGYTTSRGHWLNEARLSFLRLRVFDVPLSALGANVAADLGVTGVSSDPFTYGLPYFLVSDFSTLTDDPVIPKVQRDNSWTFTDNVSYVRGAHTMAIGFEGTRFQLNYLRDQYQRGQFTYTGAYTQDLNSPSDTGDAFADFLLGYPQNTIRNVGNTQAYLRQNDFAGYFQDDWRASSRLTLNLGVRYQYTSPYTETRGNLLNLDYSRLPAAPRLVRTSRAANPDRRNFAPRAGLAWRLPGSFFTRHSTTFRAGYGIYFAPEIAVSTYDLVLNGIRSEQNQADGIVPVLTTRNGFPQTASLGFPALFGLNPNSKTPYVQQWQGGFQHELPGRMVLELAYVGTKGTRLGRFRQNNTPAHTVTGQNLAPRPGDLQSLREFPSLGPIVQRENLANSIYHSMQVKLEKRLSARFTLLASFVWSKMIDDADSPIVGLYDSAGAQDERNLHLERGLSFADVRRRLVVAAVYNFPRSRFLRPVLSNWQLSTVVTLQDGTPLNPLYYFSDFANSGTPNRPNVVRGQSISGPGKVEEWFNTAAFSDPAPYTFGNAGRDIIPGPGNNIFNLAAQRRFNLNERVALAFRAEYFNAFNHPNFGIPLPYVDFAPLFGRILATGEPRRAQFALRLEF